MLRRLPILEWLPKYTTQTAVADLVAGITVGLTLIPQSIAYAALADLSPQVRINARLRFLQVSLKFWWKNCAFSLIGSKVMVVWSFEVGLWFYIMADCRDVINMYDVNNMADRLGRNRFETFNPHNSRTWSRTIMIFHRNFPQTCFFQFPPLLQYGLYSALCGGLVYMVFGTIPEISIAPTALLSLLTFNYTHDLGPDFAVLLCFYAGCVELLCGICNLGECF